MFRQVTMIDGGDWDGLVEKTYGKSYSFQQQDGCKERGIQSIQVPCESPDDFENDTLPEKVNHEQMGVSFKAWLERDPAQALPGRDSDSWTTDLWWARNFYPHIDMLVNDLHQKGLLPVGDYIINIDW